jgi:hypothetical protein
MPVLGCCIGDGMGGKTVEGPTKPLRVKDFDLLQTMGGVTGSEVSTLKAKR